MPNATQKLKLRAAKLRRRKLRQSRKPKSEPKEVMVNVGGKALKVSIKPNNGNEVVIVDDQGNKTIAAA